MKQKSTAANKTDEIWEKIIFESIEIKKKEPLLNYFIDKKISDHNSFQECLSYLVADNLECSFKKLFIYIATILLVLKKHTFIISTLNYSILIIICTRYNLLDLFHFLRMVTI